MEAFPHSADAGHPERTYPGTQFAITEWSAEFAGASDFSTALGDADAMHSCRERVYLSTRWRRPIPPTPTTLH